MDVKLDVGSYYCAFCIFFNNSLTVEVCFTWLMLGEVTYFCSNCTHLCLCTGNILVDYMTCTPVLNFQAFVHAHNPPFLFFFSNPSHLNRSVHILHTFLGTLPVESIDNEKLSNNQKSFIVYCLFALFSP